MMSVIPGEPSRLVVSLVKAVLALLSTVFLVACWGPDNQIDIRFRNVAEEVGVDFDHFDGERSRHLPEDMGSGAAWLDYNNDGWQDLFVANISGPFTMGPDGLQDSPAHCALYRNDGDGTFTEVSASAGLDLRAMANGVARGDYDNDGWTDLFVTTYGENYLFRNQGDGTFKEVSEEAGIGTQEAFWAGASWGDYDRDGDLDLYVTVYLKYDKTVKPDSSSDYDIQVPPQLAPASFSPHPNILYENQGDGTFVDVTDSTGTRNPGGRSLGVAWADFNGDGWPDLYVANDYSANRLFLNDQDGTFTKFGFESQVADPRGAMGLGVADWDHDRDLDLFISHWKSEFHAFYVNAGTPPEAQVFPYSSTSVDSGSGVSNDRLLFLDKAEEYGFEVSPESVGWGTGFFDFDNDGFLDVFVTNGSTLQQKSNPSRLVPQEDMLFWNRGGEKGFYRASRRLREESMFADSPFQTADGEALPKQYVGRGTAFADYDRDGDVDFFVVNHNGPGQLFQNQGRTGHHWLQVKAVGRTSNRSAIGTRLSLHTDSLVQVREVGAQPSYLSQNSLVQHFGLGTRSEVDSLVAWWPSGRRQVLHHPPIDTFLTVREPSPLSARVRGSSSTQGASDSGVRERGGTEGQDPARSGEQK